MYPTDHNRYWNWRRPITNRDRLLLSGAAAAGILLTRGIDPLSVAACFLAAGFLFYSGGRRVLAASVLLGGLSLLVRTDGFAAVLILAAALSAMTASEYIVSRSAFFLSVAGVVLSGSLTGVVPLASRPAARHADEYFVRGGIAWDHSDRLDLSTPRLVLEAGDSEPVNIRILLSAGGVRDDEPVGFVLAGDTSFPVPPGEVRIRMNEPVFPVSVVLSRRWKPMNHPVIHFIGAEAETE